jgi:hypothetical protein
MAARYLRSENGSWGHYFSNLKDPAASPTAQVASIDSAGLLMRLVIRSLSIPHRDPAFSTFEGAGFSNASCGNSLDPITVGEI